MTGPDLTAAMITAAMAKAEARVCVGWVVRKGGTQAGTCGLR
jgi:hypothetical protein